MIPTCTDKCFVVGLIQACYPKNMDAVAQKFDELVEVFAQDDGASYVLHSMMFKTMAEEQPEVSF